MAWPLYAVLLFQLVGAAVDSRPGVESSRRLLAGAIALLVPLAGPFLGMLVRHGAGRGSQPQGERPHLSRTRASAMSVYRVNRAPPVLDRLMSPDAAERLAALVSLSSVPDPTAIALLRWALDHGPTEVALDAALALEELGVRREARRESTRRALEEAPSFEHALAAADMAAEGAGTPLGDGPGVSVLAAEARAAYRVALHLAPQREAEIQARLATLELAAGRPVVALAHLARLGDPTVAAPLRERAAFAARRFDLRLPLGLAR